MGKKRFCVTLHNKPESNSDSSFELDLAPMLALMVTLIPIMLLSTVFVRIALLETPLPQVVEKAIEEDRKKKEREVNVVLDMSESGFRLMVTVDGRPQETFRLPKVKNEWDLNGFYRSAHKIKMGHPNVFRIDLKPQETVKYKDIVKVMDELRTIKKDDTKATIIDSDTKQKAFTDVMFPDVNFSNVVEG